MRRADGVLVRVAALRVEVAQDLLFGLGDGLGKLLRGKGRWVTDQSATYREEAGRLLRWARTNKLTTAHLAATR